MAYPLGRAQESKVDMYADDLFTVPASLAGLPSISLPTSVADKALPIGEWLNNQDEYHNITK